MTDFSRSTKHIEAFITTVETLLSIKVLNKRIYIYDEEKGHAHFKPKDFKKVLASKITESTIKLDEYMKNFRTLQFILCETDRLTNTQRINGKTVRVITVDMAKFELYQRWNNEDSNGYDVGRE